MGVLGLTPFLQKTCPQVFKLLPDRLQGLAGKTVAIDGTLITQRFHFSRNPHPYRHVLGWYNIIRELNECGIKTICVFDGTQRNSAKANEAVRRARVQRLNEARGSIETDRLSRLRELNRILADYDSLDDAHRQAVTGLLQTTPPPVLVGEDALSKKLTGNQRAVRDENDVPPSPALLETRKEPESDQDSTHMEGADSSELVTPDESSLLTTEDIDVSLDDLKDEMTEDDTYVISRVQDNHLPLRTVDENTNMSHRHVLDADEAEELTKSIPSALSALYVNYQDSIPKVASLAESTSRIIQAAESVSDVVEAEAQAETIMTRDQMQLTRDEGQFWQDFTTTGSDKASSIDRLCKLTDKSDYMSQSYERRTNKPTVHTYNDAKDILKAMGVPCLDVQGEFEAEALASSLVIHGAADYVVSEDTDVLMFDVPLIRNITNRQQPLTIVSGADIREGLNLERASFVDFGLLLGTDFSQRIKSVGPSRALKFIRQHKTIERVLELETKYPPRISMDEYKRQVAVARLVFATLPPIPGSQMLESQDMDDELVTLILQRCGLEKEAQLGWDYEQALQGNYFEDDPGADVPVEQIL